MELRRYNYCLQMVHEKEEEILSFKDRHASQIAILKSTQNAEL